MTQKLWKTEYDSLVGDLAGEWQGKIKTPKISERGGPQAVDPSFYVYPQFKASAFNRQLELSLDETPAKYLSGVSGSEDEYLYLTVFGEFDARFTVTIEGVFDRFKKLLKLDFEFQSGKKEFDDLFYLNPQNEEARHRLRQPEVQSAIKSVVPFVVIEVRQGSIFLSRGIRNAEQLLFAPVQKTFANLVRLAEALS